MSDEVTLGIFMVHFFYFEIEINNLLGCFNQNPSESY